MNIWQRLRDPAALIAAGTIGGVVGVLAAARESNPILGVPIAMVTVTLLMGVHVLSGVLADRRGIVGRHQSASSQQSSPPPPPLPSLQSPDSEPVSERAPVAKHATEPVLPPTVGPRPVTSKSLAVVFIHGLLSTPGVWTAFRELIDADSDLAGLETCTFQYSSPVLGLHPLKRIPDFDVIAGKLKTYLEDDLATYPNIVLVTHSQGGLVAQRFLARMLNNGRGYDLARIKRLIMFACPNSGSEVALTLRRLAWFWRHPQERQLRPLNAQITEAHRVVINQVIHARRNTAQRCPISISVYAGEEDNVVTSTSAFSVLPEGQTGVLPGDHFSIIQPDSSSHSAYVTLRKKLLEVLHEDAANCTPY